MSVILYNSPNTIHLKLQNRRFETTTKQPTSSGIAFKSYKGADWYGSSNDKSALQYKIKLTPDKINRNIKEAPTKTKGLLDSYNELQVDFNNTLKAVKSMNNINEEFGRVSSSRLVEISKHNPTGSRIPFGIGLIAQSIAMGSGDFEERIRKELRDVTVDFEEISKKYFNQQLKSIVDDYGQSANTLKRNMFYEPNKPKNFFKRIWVNLLSLTPEKREKKQKEKEAINKMKENVSESIKKVDTNYGTVKRNMSIINARHIKNTEKIIEGQKDKQSNRAIMKGLTAILSVVGLDAIFDVASDFAINSLAESALETITDQADVLTSLKDNILDDVSWNANQEAISKTASINKSNLPKTMFGVLHKIK